VAATASGDERSPAADAAEPEPIVLAWQLASRKGRVDVDRAVFTTMTWIPCMPGFPEGEDRESWAAKSAALWWSASGLQPQKEQVDTLASMLSAIHKDIYAAGHSHMAFIHLPDPRLLPLPVQLGIWAMWGDRDEQLRLLVHADEPTAVEKPILEEFTTDRLGTGLRCLQYRRGSKDGSEINSYLDYAWRFEQYETDVRLFTFSWGLDRLQRAMPDIDDLARAIFVVPRD
jgi:hypothetical protein